MSDMRLAIVPALIVSAMSYGPLRAQQLDSARGPAPVARAVRASGTIDIDGSLDEAAWQAAVPITAFRQYQPSEGAPASLPTEVWLLYDDEALYIGARLSEPTGARGVRAPLARRDQLLDANGNNGSFNSLTTDKLVVVLDPYHNRRDQALFEVNPAGVRGDQLNGDQGWDPIWTAATKIDSAGWTVEMRIPYSQLRFSRDSVQLWGMQIWRYEDRLNERDMWSFWRRSDAGGPAYFGDITGIRIGARPRQLELLPYVLSGEQLQPVDASNPFHGSHDTRIRVGGDLKYLLTSNLTLDATFYPDFGQVEVDPATLNLSPFETFYDEKRPFFIAGSSAFAFGGMSCQFCSNVSSLSVFYSRRIGRLPQLSDWVQSVATASETPDYTPILGAAKITGRTNSGYTVGLLDAVTSPQSERYLMASTPTPLSQVVEPLTNYFVGRVQKELNGGNSAIGVALTSTARRLDDSVLTDRLRGHAEAAGLDWTHTWHHHDYSWMGSAVLSSVEGSPPAVAATERSSAHYFQRPDRSASRGGFFDPSYDTLATALRGYGFYTRLAKDNGSWLWETAQNWRSPGFEVNDLAFLDRADYKWMNANLGRQWTVPTSWYRSINTIVGGQQQYSYDGLKTDAQLQAFYSMQFANYWNLRTFWIYHPTVDDDRLTRGGPAVKRTGYDEAHVQVSTDARKRAVLDMTVEVGHGVNSPTHTLILQPGLALKPMASVFVQFSPTFFTDETPAQYVTTVADSTATAFFGKRYVFAYIKTRTISLDTRVNWTFSPNLTLQLFVQPFIASGAYSSFREFVAPHTRKKVSYGTDIGTISRTPGSGSTGASYTVDPDGAGPAAPFTFADPDFTTRSLRGSAVLRWEYRPGSTVYFVWTQQRTGFDAAGTFDFGSAASAVFRDRPINLFQVKVNYWIGR